ncbi:MAG TPA: hypothetical protein VGP63_17095 [Planctomycetaceae bacterium]|nr:hypothetical protein [Planctomycetaceae bacterium]
MSPPFRAQVPGTLAKRAAFKMLASTLTILVSKSLAKAPSTALTNTLTSSVLSKSIT